MANAKKCDRCGKYYACNIYSRYTRVEPCVALLDYKPENYDLCDDCLEDLDEFMRGAKPKDLLGRIKAMLGKE